MNRLSNITLVSFIAVGLTLAGCGEAETTDADSHNASTHTHADGSVHDNHSAQGDHDHDHGEEVALAPATIGDMTVELAQAHGPLVAGDEGHLVVKLPYTDNGASVVRAWVGSEDRTLSYVGKGEYAPSHDDYDIHVVIPDPLTGDEMWWIEVEKPDGTKAVGSAVPLRE